MRSVERTRSRVLSRLADAYAVDALSVVTLEARASVALAAGTEEELAGCVWDLPARWRRARRRERPGPLRLVVEAEPLRTVVWPAGARSLVIGRDADADLVIAHPTVSGRHAELSRREGSLRIRDLGSLNGTARNGRAVEVATLRRDDLLMLGAVTIRLR
ncbi:MAG: hypothetical protein QOK21_554 [Solirubrobacteraceae bacterium]|nr:hypothetical protein [Solirubrobacteraceae bacterium]